MDHKTAFTDGVQRGIEIAEAIPTFLLIVVTIVLASPALITTGDYTHWSDYIIAFVGTAAWAGIVYAVAVIVGVA
jgi:hypothetical protein